MLFQSFFVCQAVVEIPTKACEKAERCGKDSEHHYLTESHPRIECRDGLKCTSTRKGHNFKFAHPSGFVLPPCPAGASCAKLANVVHTTQHFSHPGVAIPAAGPVAVAAAAAAAASPVVPETPAVVAAAETASRYPYT
jgi:hypothetical protein